MNWQKPSIWEIIALFPLSFLRGSVLNKRVNAEDAQNAPVIQKLVSYFVALLRGNLYLDGVIFVFSLPLYVYNIICNPGLAFYFASRFICLDRKEYIQHPPRVTLRVYRTIIDAFTCLLRRNASFTFFTNRKWNRISWYIHVFRYHIFQKMCESWTD